MVSDNFKNRCDIRSIQNFDKQIKKSTEEENRALARLVEQHNKIVKDIIDVELTSFKTETARAIIDTSDAFRDDGDVNFQIIKTKTGTTRRVILEIKAKPVSKPWDNNIHRIEESRIIRYIKYQRPVFVSMQSESENPQCLFFFLKDLRFIQSNIVPEPKEYFGWKNVYTIKPVHLELMGVKMFNMKDFQPCDVYLNYLSKLWKVAK